MKSKTIHIETIRRAVADYMYSEGSVYLGGNVADHKEHEQALAELLDIPLKIDGSGYDFGQFRTKKLNEGEEG